MKIIIFDKKPSENRLLLQELIRNLNDHLINPEILIADSEAAIALAELYDIVSYPALVVSRDDGQLIRLWQGGVPSEADVLQNYGIEAS